MHGVQQSICSNLPEFCRFPGSRYILLLSLRILKELKFVGDCVQNFFFQINLAGKSFSEFMNFLEEFLMAI